MTRFLVFVSLALLISHVSIFEYVLGAPTCQAVSSQLSPCLPYIKKNSGNNGPTVACCTGVNKIYKLAKSKGDRVVICKCLKKVLINLGNSVISYRVSQLPYKCGVSNFKMPPVDKNYNCNK